MSLIVTLRALLNRFPCIDDFAGFHVDYTAPDREGFGVYPTGETKISEDMAGASVWEYNFALQALFFTADDYMRIQNCEFVEQFQRWLDGFNRAGIELGDGLSFVSIGAGGGLLTDWDEDEQRGTYAIQCKLTYERM